MRKKRENCGFPEKWRAHEPDQKRHRKRERDVQQRGPEKDREPLPPENRYKVTHLRVARLVLKFDVDFTSAFWSHESELRATDVSLQNVVK